MHTDGAVALTPDRPAPGSDDDHGPGSDGATVTPADDLRRRLRAWLDDNLTPEIVAAGTRGYVDGDALEVLRGWNARLADAGWAAIGWPVEHGGRAATVPEQLAYHEVMTEARAPGPVNVIGVANIAPAIMAVGRPDQKERFLAPMLRGDEIWSQGMSEPDAGSDLASLATRAEVVDDAFVVNGQKTWNSLGQYADWCQLYVRTGPPGSRHKGITCLLVDMRTPGIEVRPLRTMTGDAAFAEVFLTDVVVPRTALLGEVDHGWNVAMTTLSFERAGVAKLHLSLAAGFDELVAEARRLGVTPSAPLRDRMARLYASIACLGFMTTRDLQAAEAGRPPSPASGSLTKLLWAAASQELAGVGVDLLGCGALADRWTGRLTAAPSLSIAGGTTEINRTIVAEHGLGLPR